MEKMKKTAKGLDTFFKIVGVLVYVAGACLILAAVVLLLADLLGNGSYALVESLEFGSVSFVLAPGYVRDGMMYYIGALVLGMVFIVLVSVWIKTIRNILKPMMEGLPFHRSVGDNLKKLGWLEIFGGIAAWGFELVKSLMMVNTYDLAELFVSEKITAVNVNYDFDISFLITAAVFFLASYIFRYGAQLQQMSDETL